MQPQNYMDPVTQYPQQQQYFQGASQQPPHEQQVYGHQQNRIIMHNGGQKDKDDMKKSLNAAIFNNQ